MKKAISLFILVLALGAGLVVAQFNHKAKTTTPTSSKQVVAVPSPTLVTTNSPDIPVKISIPSLEITTAVQSVGQDNQGRMDVPSNNVDVAWYKYGTKPGDTGSAVIDGHYDTVTGAPAVFYYLKKLTPRDTIIVTDDKGAKYTFTVSQIISYPYNSLPLTAIFTKRDTARLNLITCAGTWDTGQHNYSERTVVYAVLTK